MALSNKTLRKLPFARGAEDLPAVLKWLEELRQHINARTATRAVSVLHFEVLNVEPAKPRTGMMAIADGAGWKPGGSAVAGLYFYTGSSWSLIKGL